MSLRSLFNVEQLHVAVGSLFRNSTTNLGGALRSLFLGRVLGACGEMFRIGPGAVVAGHRRIRVGSRVSIMHSATLHSAEEGRLTIGDDCSFNANVQFLAGPRGAITVGDKVLIGPNSVIRNCDHNWRDPDRPIRDQGHTCRDIVIEDDVWLAAGVVVLGGAVIKRGTVVAAGAVVRRGEYGPNAVLAGNPAVQVSTRGQEG